MRNVILIGFMGSGKTTFGKKLAKQLAYRFVDTDQCLEQQFGMSVSEIFATKGESVFRQAEFELIESFQPNQGMVISSGGGMPCIPGAMDLLNQLGLTCYLQLPAGMLYQRLVNARTPRPLISQQAPEDQKSFVEHLLQLRESDYLKAQVVIDPRLAEKNRGYILSKLL